MLFCGYNPQNITVREFLYCFNPFIVVILPYGNIGVG